MRPQFIRSVLWLAFGMTALLLLLSKATCARRDAPVESRGVMSKPAAAEETGAAGRDGQRRIQAGLPVDDSGARTNHAELAGERLAELRALAMNDDAASLDAIFSELANPDPQIRRGALEAVIQFGDRSAIPRLQTLAEQVDNETERAEMLSAIEFLNLPELTDRAQVRSGQRKPGWQAHTNRPAKNPFVR